MNNEVIAKKNIVKQRPVMKYIRCDGADKTRHEHSHPELIFVAEGSGRFEVGDNQYPIKTGDLIICSRNVSHSEYIFDAPESKIFHLGFVDTVLLGFEKDEIIYDPFCIIHTQNEDYEILRSYFTALKLEHDERRLCGRLIEEDLTRLLLIAALRLAFGDMNPVFMQNKSFFEAKDYFDKNFLTITSIEEACKKLDINKFYLTHIFKEQLGMPPIRYLQLKRMEKAKSLISNGCAINEVAEKCGYSDTAYFCRVFKKLTGISPLQFRGKVKPGNQ